MFHQHFCGEHKAQYLCDCASQEQLEKRCHRCIADAERRKLEEEATNVAID